MKPSDYHEALAEVERLKGQLAECYRLSGADPDGNDDSMLAPHAVEEVKRLREETDAEIERLSKDREDQRIALDELVNVIEELRAEVNREKAVRETAESERNYHMQRTTELYLERESLQQERDRLREALDRALSALREEKRFGTVAMIQASLINDGKNLAADEFRQALAAKETTNHPPVIGEGIARKLNAGQPVDRNACDLLKAQQECDRLRKALGTSKTAIADWLNTYAPEFCNPLRVEEANRRISDAGGTISYIADVNQVIQQALPAKEPATLAAPDHSTKEVL